MNLFVEEYIPTLQDQKRPQYAVDALVGKTDDKGVFHPGYWSGMSVDDVVGRSAREYAEHRNKAPGTIRKELGVLNKAIKFAVHEGFLKHGPLAPLPPKPAPKERWLTRDEAARLLRSVRAQGSRSRHAAHWIAIALRTGQRKTAILQLRTTKSTVGGYVDLEKRRIDFNPLGKRQTKKRRPIIPIPGKLMPLLRALVKNSEHGYIIEQKFAKKGGSRPVANIKGSFKRNCADAGIKGATPHTMRHTFVTWLCHKGVPIDDIAAYAGMTRKTVEEVYGHHHPDYMEKARRAIR